MAIDKTMLDAMTSGYKFYLDDMKSKNITGQYYDEVERLYKRLEEIGQESADMNEMYAKMQNENITVKMSDAYTRALTEEGNKNYMPQNGEVPDDSQLFKNNIDALRNCIKTLRDNYENTLEKATESQRMRIMVENNPEDLIKSIEDMIALAEEPGMTYANFLRIQIERGLDKAAEGITTRSFIEDVIEFKKAFMLPEIEIKMWEEKLEEYNKVAANNKFNLVELHEWEFISDRIERKYKPEIVKRERINDMFMKIVGDLGDWIMSYCSYPPYELMPWSVMSHDAAIADLTRIQKVTPGIVKEREKLLFRYFGLRLKDIIKDEYFLNDIKSNMIDDSQEYLEFLLLEVYPQCKPFNDASRELIDKQTSMYKGKKEVNPGKKEPYLRMKKYYDSKYGEGYMEKSLKEQGKGDIDKAEYTSNASPWNLESFLSHVEGKIVEPDLNETFVDNSTSAKIDEATSTIKEKAGGLFSFFKR
ncbi:MAG: hypothetical protein J6T48_02675 [Bacteroidales bacterium]|nr:hypothetical protein [Bacteroidales bacterium]